MKLRSIVMTPLAAQSGAALVALVLGVISGPACVEAAAPGESFQDCDTCPEMVVVPAGQFIMGTAESEAGRLSNEGPQREVTISRAFAVSKYEITIGQYRQFSEETNRGVRNNNCVVVTGLRGGEPVQGKSWEDPNYVVGEDHPVACISWNDSQDFVDWLTKKTGKPYRLLSEAEWEYAARAGTSTRYSFGNDEVELCDYGNVPDLTAKAEMATKDGWSPWLYVDCDDGYGLRSAPVGTYKPNAFGLYDMHGNVWEWVEDCYYESFAGAPKDGSVWGSDDACVHVVRGGSLSAPVSASRSAMRFGGTTELRGPAAEKAPKEWHNFNLGLRIARGVN
ncbi:MAG: formylglycine-generating enzyme family protein [Rhodospirillaceae bacterium]